MLKLTCSCVDAGLSNGCELEVLVEVNLSLLID